MRQSGHGDMKPPHVHDHHHEKFFAAESDWSEPAPPSAPPCYHTGRKAEGACQRGRDRGRPRANFERCEQNGFA